MFKNKDKLVAVLLLSAVFFCSTTTICAQKAETFEGTIQSVSENFVRVQVNSGQLEGETISVKITEAESVADITTPEYKEGDAVVLTKEGENGEYYISSFVRRNDLLVLFAIFILLAVVIGGLRGVASLAGLAISFLVVLKFLIPQISAGYDPVLISILSSLIIIPATFYLSHGLNKKTTAAIVGTLVSLIITGLLAYYFVSSANITGYASDEAGFLKAVGIVDVNMQALVLAGIIIGLLGVLDDITVAQSAVVEQIYSANKDLGKQEIFKRSMQVGKDHIASMVNTLVLVYAGASLPLLLLFTSDPQPITQLVNYELLAEEITRMLLGSIGLILAVPVTTAIAAFWFSRRNSLTQ